MPKVALHWEKYLEHIIQKYNNYVIFRCQRSHRMYGAHFLFQYGKIRDESKNVAVIMGHADISVTLNTYTHVNFEDAKEEVRRIVNE